MKKLILLICLVYSTIVLSQSPANSYDADVPNHYFSYSLKLVKETAGFTPPVAARAFGFMGLALYESVVPGIPDHTSTLGKISGLVDVTSTEAGVDYHWPTVANNALAVVVDSLFRTASQANRDSLAEIRDLYNSLFQSQLSGNIFEDSKAFGEAIADDIFNYSRTDGGHTAFVENFPVDYMPPVGESYWVPFGTQVCLQPYWGIHRPFIEADTSISTISPPPPDFSTDPSSDFYEYALHVYNTSQSLTADQENIALYWADGGGSITPGGHSISMLHNVLQSENANLELATKAYAKLGIALSDAFLACWKTKYIYNLCRPVTYIRTLIDTAWLPLIGTPPFPEYPSGHSSQSGAMGAVMTDLFGDLYEFTDVTHGVNFGGPRHFFSFAEAAEEAAISRLYGGIHYEFGNHAGLDLGTIVGLNVIQLFEALNVAVKDPTGPPFAIDLYPNPADEQLLVRSHFIVPGTGFSIYDITGKIQMTGKLDHDIQSVPIVHLASGLYVFKINHTQAGVYRFVKN